MGLIDFFEEVDSQFLVWQKMPQSQRKDRIKLKQRANTLEKRKPTRKQQKRLDRQKELLKHFNGDFYQEKEVGDEVYVKQYNKNQDRWQVAVYTKQSFRKYKSIQQK